MPEKHEDTGRFGGPGASHEDRSTGKATHHGSHGGPVGPGEHPTDMKRSDVSGGGGETDRNHDHKLEDNGRNPTADHGNR